jgi:FeS assembly SUF system protein
MNTFVPLKLDDKENHIKPAPMIDIPDSASVEDKIIAAIKTVFDPEIPVDIYALGLIYSVKYDAESQKAEIVMTLTSPGCFAAGMIPGQVEQAALRVAEVKSVHVELTFDPPWDKEMMSEAAKLELGFW